MIWVVLGKLAVTGFAGYLIVPFVALSTMDSGWRWPWVIGFLLMAAVVFGVWFA